MTGISDLGRLFSTAQRLSDKIENFEKVKVRNDLEISAITEMRTDKNFGEFQIKKETPEINFGPWAKSYQKKIKSKRGVEKTNLKEENEVFAFESTPQAIFTLPCFISIARLIFLRWQRKGRSTTK